MCTVVLLIRPDHAWPVILMANRDERLDRAWDPPAAYWPGQPNLIAGRDRTAGGTWMGVNGTVTAAVLNRAGTLGPAAGKRSRGELPLMALTHPTAEASAAAIAAENAAEWRDFNLVIADSLGALFVRGTGQGHPAVHRLPSGVSMLTSRDPNDPVSPRVRRHLARFDTAAQPMPDRWDEWRAILSDRSGPAPGQMNVVPRGGFGTVCSSFLAIPARGEPVWLFAAGPPDMAPFEPVRVTSDASRP